MAKSASLNTEVVNEIISDPNTQRYFEVLSQVDQGLHLSIPFVELENRIVAAEESGIDPMPVLAEYTTFSLKELNAIRHEEAMILNSLHLLYGEEMQGIVSDESLSNNFSRIIQRAYIAFLNGKNLKVDNACGSTLDLTCEGSRDCYYGNDLDTYVATCRDRAGTIGWRVFQGSIATGVGIGAGAGSFFFGVGAGPGGVTGGLFGFAVGTIGGIITYGALGDRCRLTLYELCATCKARCWEP